MKRVLQRSCACAIAALLMLAGPPGVAQVLTVHEWGTITTRHAADGTPQGRLNRIEAAEVLPAFVHRFEPVQSRLDPARGALTYLARFRDRATTFRLVLR